MNVVVSSVFILGSCYKWKGHLILSANHLYFQNGLKQNYLLGYIYIVLISQLRKGALGLALAIAMLKKVFGTFFYKGNKSFFSALISGIAIDQFPTKWINKRFISTPFFFPFYIDNVCNKLQQRVVLTFLNILPVSRLKWKKLSIQT